MKFSDNALEMALISSLGVLIGRLSLEVIGDGEAKVLGGGSLSLSLLTLLTYLPLSNNRYNLERNNTKQPNKNGQLSYLVSYRGGTR